MKVWLNGRIVPPEAGLVSTSDRGFTLGDGLFETLLVAEGKARRFERHWARLERGAGVLGIPLTRDVAGIRAAIDRLLAENGRAAGAVRLTLTRGPAARGLRVPPDPVPTWLITLGDLPELLPVDVVVATVTRRNERSPLAAIKSLNYLDQILALQEAVDTGAGDALLLNTAGRIAGASAANCFFLLDGSLVTPPLGDGPLPGIARAILLEAGIAVEQSIAPEKLRSITGGFLSNSLGLRAIRRIDGRACGDAASLLEHCRKLLQSAG